MPDVGTTALHLLGAIGFVIVVAYGTPTAPLRKIWPSMMSCPTCCGVWGGAAWGALLALRPWLPGVVGRLHDVAAFAFAVSFFGYLSASLLGVVTGLNRPRGGPPKGAMRWLHRTK